MTPPQSQTSDVLIRASAGTGKTFQLSNRFLALMARDVAIDHILAITFTRKAAREISDRVLMRLAEATVDPDKLSELREHVSPSLDRPRCLDLLRQLVTSLHRLRISTLDSFFSRVAGSFSLELGMPPDWRIIDDWHDTTLRSEAIRMMLLSESHSAMITLLRLMERGDTTRAVQQRMRQNVDALYELFRESSEDAWTTIPRRPSLSDEEVSAAIDGVEALNDFPDKRFSTARNKDVANARAGDWEGFVQKGLPNAILTKGAYYKRDISQEIQAAYEPLIVHANSLFLHRLADRTESMYRLLEKFDGEYLSLKAQEGAYRFDDIAFLLAVSLDAANVSDWALRLDADATHLLLDEFQDTSLRQWQVIAPVAQAVAGQADDRSFFCVGDVKQAIYGWRGGVSEIFDAVSDQLPGVQEQSLDTTWRSAPVIVETVNRVFETLSSNAVLQEFPRVADLWQDRFHRHVTQRKKLLGHCQLLVSPSASTNGRAEQTEATLTFAAEQIARIACEHPSRSIGVLVRRNEAAARLIYQLRTVHEIPASEEGGSALTDSFAVEAILSLLRIADHPSDTPARFHVAATPLGRAVGLTDYSDDALASRLSLQIRNELLTDGYGTTIYRWARSLADVCDARELRRLNQLLDAAYGYDTLATLRPSDFVRYVEMSRMEDPSESRVRVMTIHKAKGLEFDIVVLPELDQKVLSRTPPVVVGRPRPFDPVDRVCAYAKKEVQLVLPPDLLQMHEDWKTQTLNEWLCGLYVAMTRAVHSLYMITEPSVKDPEKAPKTYASLLRNALAGGQPLQPLIIPYDSGTPDWDTAPLHTVPETAIEPIETETTEAVEVILADAPARRRRNLNRESPSRLKHRGPVDLRQMIEKTSPQAAARGTLLHAWFEQIEWLDDGEPTDAILQDVAAICEDRALDLETELAGFRKMLQQPAIRESLSRSGYDDLSRLGLPDDVSGELVGEPIRLAVYRELPFAIRNENDLLNGVIDRLVVLSVNDRPAAADVIDFKSDAVSTDGPYTVEAAVDNYRPQLLAYRAAVSRLFDLGPSQIATRLLFLGPAIARTVN